MNGPHRVTRCFACLLLLLLLPACAPSFVTKPTVEAQLATASAVVRPHQTATLAPTRAPEGSPTASPTPSATAVPVARLEQAREAEWIGERERAIALYDSLRGDPAYAHEALFYLADLYLREERQVEAGLAWQEALAREPDGPFADYIRYRLARGLAAIGQHAQAIELLERFDAANDEADAMVAQRLAESHLTLGQRDGAAAQWQRLYEMEDAPRVTRALSARQLGEWESERERWIEALAWFERSLELSRIDSFRAELIAEMAEVALRLEDGGYARNQWQLLLDDYPDQPQALQAAARLAEAGEEPLSQFQMGELYLANEQWANAVRASFRSLEEEADRPEAHALAAEGLEAGGNLAGALREWQKILDTHPEAESLHDDALYAIGRLHAALGDEGSALASWEQLETGFPGSERLPAALWERATLLRDQRADPAGAAGAFEALAGRFPDESGAADALWQAGMLWYRLGEAERAEAAFSGLARMDAEQPARAPFWAGKAALLDGEEALARRHWETARGRDPADYYALRAGELLSGERWQPRAERDFTVPDEGEMAWLRDAAGLPDDAPLDALPDEPRLARGEALLLMGERDAALDEFGEAIRAQAEEPQALWAMARRFRELHLNSYSIRAAEQLMALLDHTPFSAPPALAAMRFPIPFEGLLRGAAAEWGYDPLFFAALIYQESRWEPRARSYAAARGLTQVIPDTGNWIAQRLGDGEYRYAKLDRPLVSFRYGSYYIDYVLGLFDDNPYHALAAYNGGPGNARRWLTPDDDLYLESISLGETRNYVEWIYEHWRAYEHIYRPTP